MIGNVVHVLRKTCQRIVARVLPDVVNPLCTMGKRIVSYIQWGVVRCVVGIDGQHIICPELTNTCAWHMCRELTASCCGMQHMKPKEDCCLCEVLGDAFVTLLSIVRSALCEVEHSGKLCEVDPPLESCSLCEQSGGLFVVLRCLFTVPRVKLSP